MFEKVLIAEDHESASISVQKTLEEIGIARPDYVYYCDDALVRIQKAVETGQPYDLLITDLVFDSDHRKERLTDGAQLIRAAQAIDPSLPVLVFSAEGRIAVIETLYTLHQIDGYVQKGRGDATELKQALIQITGNQRYFPRFYIQATRRENVHDFEAFDIKIISLLAAGMRQKDIPDYLKRNKIKPDGLSSIEKRLKRMKEGLNFSTNEQLVAYCTEMGIV
ncbi:MAG TPA: response regulator [Puia sp.]|jgi:DNA-binding NarL/FixJ family response regulator